MSDTTQTARPCQQSGRTRRKRDGKQAPSASNRAVATKKAKLEALLARTRGATLAQLQKELVWKPHTVRAAISGRDCRRDHRTGAAAAWQCQPGPATRLARARHRCRDPRRASAGRSDGQNAA
ncbi:MAG: DUF3489 domain-containing protein [Silicimonas sp.]|nr:DUF3489 domain-containing protein [Silicimonas sp.]